VLVHDTILFTEDLVRAYLDNGLLSFKIRSEKNSFALDMLSALIYDERSVQTVLLTKQSANHRFTQDGLLILAPWLLSYLP